MKHIKKFQEHIQEKVSHRDVKDKPYQMYYSDHNMRSAVGGQSVAELISYARDLNLKSFDIFKNGPHFHSTTQEEYLIHWYDSTKSGYYYHVSLRDPEIAKLELKFDEPAKSGDFFSNDPDTQKDDFERRGE